MPDDVGGLGGGRVHNKGQEGTHSHPDECCSLTTRTFWSVALLREQGQAQIHLVSLQFD